MRLPAAMYYVHKVPPERPCCVWCRIMFWACFVNTGIYLYTLRGRTPDLAMLWPRSPPALYVLHVRVLVTRDRAATGTERWQLRCQLLCHCMLGQDRDSSVTGPSLVTISSQLVREPIIITRSLSSSSWPRRPEVGRLIPHTYSTHTLRASVPCRPFEQPETRVEVSNSLSECVV